MRTLIRLKIVLSLLFVFVLSYTYGQSNTSQQAPLKISKYIESNFSSCEVIDYKIKNGFHEVLFSDGTKLFFDKELAITKIESNCKLPDIAVQSEIVKYVKENFPEEYVKVWELDGNKQKIILKYDRELTFSKTGELITME